jgi:hypothetical protein
MRKRLGRAAAWLVTAGLLFFVFHKISFADLVASTRAAKPWMVPACLASVFGLYLADAFAIWKTFGWFLAKFTYGEVLVLRGATYLLAAINYNVGQGAIAFFVHRARAVPLMRGVATILLVMGINVLTLLLFASAGLLVAPEVPRAIVVVVVVAYAGLALYGLVVAWKPPWLATRPLFDVLLSAGLSGHARALLVRVPHVATVVVFQMAMLRAFGVAVPIGQAVAALPIVILIAALPISVMGLGTTQGLLVFFFARYAPGVGHERDAAVVAASISSQAIALSTQALIGLACLQSRIGRELRAAAASATAPAGPDAPAPVQ